MKKVVIFFITQLIFVSVLAQSWSAREILVANGGLFGNSSENANIGIIDPTTLISSTFDTIGTQSVQDIVVHGDIAFLAAQDSIIKYSLTSRKRLAAIKFPGVSTHSLLIHDTLLIAGNFYGQTKNNIVILKTSDLSVVETVKNVFHGVRGMAVLNDLLYVSQNLTGSFFQDSMGYLKVVNLNNTLQTDSIFIDLVAPTGKLFVFGDAIIGISGNSIFSVRGGINSWNINTKNYNLSNNPKHGFLTSKGKLFTSINGKGIGSYDLNSWEIDTMIVDEVITAFTVDTVNKLFYLTQTDYFSYQNGLVYDFAGNKKGEFDVGFSPEAIEIAYEFSSGLSRENHNSTLIFYPNPVSDYIYLSEPSDITIFSLTGKELLKGRRVDKLNVSSLISGVYILRGMDVSGNVSSQKIIRR